MLRRKKILLCLVFCLAVEFCSSQKTGNEVPQEKYRAVHWGMDEGMSNGVVSSIIQDVNGFLWVATDFGLDRFDGSTFKKYYENKYKGNKTIIGNQIEGLIEDSLHNIWIGTRNGLSRYDIKADTFTNFPANRVIIPFWATTNEIFTLANTGNQEYLIRTYNTHTFLRKDVGKIVHADSLGYAYSDQSAIYDAGSNSVWMQTGFSSWPDGGLTQISLTDGRKTKYTWMCYRNIPHHSHWTEGMRYDPKRNSIWISSPDGLVEFTLRDKQYHLIDAMNELIRRNDFHNWAGINIDQKGRIWMGTIPKGIIIYDPETNSISVPFPGDSVTQKNVSDENLTIYCDKKGMVWSGFWTGKGIYQLIPFSPTITRFEISAGSCMKGYGGNIWLCSSDGIKIFDPYENSFSLLSKKKLGFHDEFLLPINVDNSSKKAWVLAWMAHSGRPFEIDLNSKKSYPVSFEDSKGRYKVYDSLNLAAPHGLVPTSFKNGLIFLVSFTDHQAIFQLNSTEPVAQEILTFPASNIDRLGLCTDDDHSIFLRTEGSTNLTYCCINNKWTRTSTPFDSIQWSKIVFNKSDNTYWVITETEIAHYNKNFKLIRTYSQDDGLPNVRIFGVLPDKNGNIWLNTERSLYQLNVKTGTVMMLSEKDGFFPKDVYDFSGVSNVDGNLYFMLPTDHALYALDPDKLLSSPSSVYLQSLQVNEHPVDVTTGVNNLQELSLRYFQNKITLETGTIDYYSRGKNNIRYKLESAGRPASWQYAPAYYTIRYEGLAPGNYKLILQASNASNEFSGPLKTLMINISPAVWNTWWFRAIAFLFLVDMIYSFVQWRTRQRFKLRLERSEKERQLAELQQQKMELEMQALRAQMNPHFIFNSLNSINRFILQNNRQQASEYLTKFSRLVRMILQNSQASLISLESELESLRLYLEMEALRFDYHFAYKISVPKDLEPEMLKVPPLIIQPYVENAIWHGLMQREESGRLDIEVSQENHHLFFKITDDGIGRKKAAELASKSATKHKSMGLKITKERIEMLQKTAGNESLVRIIDLVNSDGSAAGTEVTIKIPVLHD